LQRGHNPLQRHAFLGSPVGDRASTVQQPVHDDSRAIAAADLHGLRSVGDPAGAGMRNALTVDVEDYFQVAAFSGVLSRDSWERAEPRVERNTHALLEIFAEYDCKATFFVLGWVAERYPSLVQAVEQAGHEIGSHGYSHRLIYEQTPIEFQRETDRAKKLLEDIIGAPVLGYRAASYSITQRSLWALDILADAGFEYDSSIFPIRHDRYGLIGAPAEPHRISLPSGNTLVEFPISTVRVGPMRLPVSGGGYFRLYPYALSRLLATHKRRRTGNPFVFYLHPWEIDPGQPRIEAGALSRFRHYNNLARCEARLRRLLTDFEFTTMRTCLAELAQEHAAALPVHSYDFSAFDGGPPVQVRSGIEG
jgi:polysaccharide deacetylase family protein (PEP-CTERM system associated)